MLAFQLAAYPFLYFGGQNGGQHDHHFFIFCFVVIAIYIKQSEPIFYKSYRTTFGAARLLVFSPKPLTISVITILKAPRILYDFLLSLLLLQRLQSFQQFLCRKSYRSAMNN
jgi:hypothetical protein